ncbi:hypothetical protein [Bosea sp. AS-1]|jgi:hypothetical protein|uniref:hypothetical protein n=1 Tax=Bosea sp. AS-1 TaxID=2015316 RepID=UPI000B793B8B|nr:hypothetical protein [Bosea sp. AS-1]
MTAPTSSKDDSLAREANELLSSAEAGGTRWLDLCFRLIVLALAALWLLMPPTDGAHVATDGKAIATTR